MARRKNPEDLICIPKKIQINEEISEWLDWYSDRTKKSAGAYIRTLIYADMRRVKAELSKQNQMMDSAKVGPNTDQTGGLSPETMQIIIAVADLIRSQSGDRRKSPRIK